MLSDSCFDALHDLKKGVRTVDSVIAELKHDIDWYANSSSVGYDKNLIAMLNEAVENFEKSVINKDRLIFILGRTVAFLDNPRVSSHSVLFKECDYVPKAS